MKATIKVGFDVLGIPSSLSLYIDGREPILVSHDISGKIKATITIESEDERYIKDIWSEGLLEMLCINVNDDELSRINEAKDIFCVSRM